jgi:DNA polymerase III subunit chi
MTQIDFYTNVSDKLHTLCRLVAKGHSLGRKVLIYCPDAETAQRIDRMLWTTPPTAFVPHCGPSDPLADVTPIIIDYIGAEPLQDQILINVRSEWPPFFGRFERLIEIVSLDAEDRRTARERYRFYRDRGYEIRTHDLAAANSAA